MASVITLDQIKGFANHFEMDLTDGTQYPGVVGSLETWESGRGELDNELVNGEATKEIFAPLVAAHEAAKQAASTADGAADGQTSAVDGKDSSEEEKGSSQA